MRRNDQQGDTFEPRFGDDGLLTAVVVDMADNEVLMVAHLSLIHI